MATFTVTIRFPRWPSRFSTWLKCTVSKGKRRRAKQHYDEIHVATYQPEAKVGPATYHQPEEVRWALAKHIVQQAADLDDTRRSLAGDDPVRDALLADIEQVAFRQLYQNYRDHLSGYSTDEEPIAAAPEETYDEAEPDGKER